MKKIALHLASGQRQCPILVGNGLIYKAAVLTRDLKAKHAVIVADEALPTARRRLRKVLLAGGWRVDEIALPATESTKDFRRTFPLYGKLVDFGTDRSSVIFALGGGVIGDLSGFLAATYWRGVRWVGVPTTFLAQVDSAIGGKTGVNHPLGKNLIGAFHQPSLVLCDPSLLSTLSVRDRISGFAEAVKYGLIFDPGFFRFLVDNRAAVLALRPDVSEEVIAKCVQWKAKVVARDERETRGLRFHLNFGHTLGHALEAATGYRRYRHGEAIVWGMRWAVALSERRGHLPARVASAIDEKLAELPVPALPKGLRLETLLPYLKRDKKHAHGELAFVLLKKVGKAVLDRAVREADLRTVLTATRR